VTGVEPGEGIEERRDPAPGDHPDDDATPHDTRHVVDRVTHGRRRGEGGTGVGQGRGAGGGQRHGAAGAVEQRRAELALQLADLGADARLGDVHAAGRPGEVGGLGDGDEVLELAELHDCEC
jgi:hypothetical protein